MNQAEADRAALDAYPELKRLIAIRRSGAWQLDVQLDQEMMPRLVLGSRRYSDGSEDTFAVRSRTEVRAIRLDPQRQWIFRREGSLVEIVDALVELPSPLHPMAPRLVLPGTPPRLWVPDTGRRTGRQRA
jgi:hypothetical protein